MKDKSWDFYKDSGVFVTMCKDLVFLLVCGAETAKLITDSKENTFGFQKEKRLKSTQRTEFAFNYFACDAFMKEWTKQLGKRFIFLWPGATVASANENYCIN